MEEYKYKKYKNKYLSSKQSTIKNEKHLDTIKYKKEHLDTIYDWIVPVVNTNSIYFNKNFIMLNNEANNLIKSKITPEQSKNLDELISILENYKNKINKYKCYTQFNLNNGNECHLENGKDCTTIKNEIDNFNGLITDIDSLINGLKKKKEEYQLLS